MIIGIDASHIVKGGALQQLQNFVEEFIKNNKEDTLVIWSTKNTLKKLKKSKKILKKNNLLIEFSFFTKCVWQFFLLPFSILTAKCKTMVYFGGVMSFPMTYSIIYIHNLLPFQKNIKKKYFPKLFFFKLYFLRLTLKLSIIISNKVIFFSKHSLKVVSEDLNIQNIKKFEVIPHTVKSITYKERPLQGLDKKKNIEVIYVSAFDIYKGHFELIDAIKLVKKKIGKKIKVKFIGSIQDKEYYQNLVKLINKEKDLKKLVTFKLDYSHKKTLQNINKTDIFFFSSVCETFGLVLLEALLYGKPILCSNNQPMKEILKNNAMFFSLNNVNSLCKKLISITKYKSKKLQKIKNKNTKFLDKYYDSLKIYKQTIKIYKRY